jgi:hypothetical protein
MRNFTVFVARSLIRSYEKEKELLGRNYDYWDVERQMLELDNRIKALKQLIEEIDKRPDITIGVGSLLNVI